MAKRNKKKADTTIKDKEDFLTMLTYLDREQISAFIKQKGKEPKVIKPFIYLNSN